MMQACKRSVYIEVNLDALTQNIQVLRARCPNPDKTGMIAVVKAGAYGHGSVIVSRHLKSIGVERLAVATVQEGVHLRKHGIQGPLHILGNLQPWEMRECVDQSLTPTISSTEAVRDMAEALKQRQHSANSPQQDSPDFIVPGSVNIKVDSGMSRNGCPPEELSSVIKACEDQGVTVDGIFTHFADSWGNPEFTRGQLDTFLKATEPYRNKGIRFHVANSGAILRGYGLDLDFIRPGITVYGLPPDTASDDFVDFGLKPAVRVIGHPTLVKLLPAGRKVGYSGMYTTEADEWIATIPIGYADGYWRHLSGKGVVIREKTGERCPVVGRVSMDAITVRVPEEVPCSEAFILLSDDYDPHTSACGQAAATGTISYEVCTRLSVRLPRLYTQGSSKDVIHAILPESY